MLARPPAERVAAVQHLLDTLVTSGRVGPVTSRPIDGAFVVSVDGQDVFGILPLDVDHLIADLDKRKKTVVKAGEPAWRRLERIREERETAERLSDFDDYEIDDGDGDGDGAMKRKRK